MHASRCLPESRLGPTPPDVALGGPRRAEAFFFLPRQDSASHLEYAALSGWARVPPSSPLATCLTCARASAHNTHSPFTCRVARLNQATRPYHHLAIPPAPASTRHHRRRGCRDLPPPPGVQRLALHRPPACPSPSTPLPPRKETRERLGQRFGAAFACGRRMPVTPSGLVPLLCPLGRGGCHLRMA